VFEILMVFQGKLIRFLISFVRVYTINQCICSHDFFAANWQNPKRSASQNLCPPHSTAYNCKCFQKRTRNL